MDQATFSPAKSWTVPASHDGARLDAFARACLPHMSRREIEKALREKLFTVNGRTGRKGDRLTAADELFFIGADDWLATEPCADTKLDVPIIFEDGALLMLAKPAGLATHGFSARGEPTLANFIAAERPEILHIGAIRWEPGMVHRLDRDTSGLVLVAKTQKAFGALKTQFRHRRIRKIYLALVWGATPAGGVIDSFLAHDARDKRRMALASSKESRNKTKQWPAVTRYRKLATGAGMSLLEVAMETGVTHQIRTHLAAHGHPIVGDILYGNVGSETFGLKRHFLHAWQMEFRHPSDGHMMKLQADLPADLDALLNRLGMAF